MLDYPEDLESKYIDFAKKIMDEGWMNQQLRLVDEVSQYKEKGSYLGLFHPFIRNYLDIRITFRKAIILNNETMLMGVGHSNIVELGRNLYELHGLYDEKKTRARLQSKDYEDVCWELEVMMALKYSGVQANFEREKEIPSFDISAFIGSENIAIECKNKHIEDKEYNFNKIFSHFLSEKVIQHLTEVEGRHDIKIEIDGTGKIEDVKQLAQTIREMLKSKITYMNYKNVYEITMTNKYKNIPTGIIMKSNKEEFCVSSSVRNSLKEVYTKNEEMNYKDRIFYRFKSQDLSVKNLNSLLSTANKQIAGNQGCVFLKVPHYAFNESISEVEGLLQRFYSNISGVKIIALKKDFIENSGVKVARKEKLILNEHAKIQLSQTCKSTFEQPMMFKKYA